MKVYDDLLPPSYQEAIKETFLFSSFPWYFLNDVTFGKLATHNKSPALSHLLVNKGEIISRFYDFLQPMVHIAAHKENLTLKKVVQCRTFLQFPSTGVSSPVDNLHIDLPYDHTVFLYYVTNSDGDTVITNRARQGSQEELNLTLDDASQYSTVTPKQGRLVIFDGRYYHTAYRPSKDIRCVINFDIITE